MSHLINLRNVNYSEPFDAAKKYRTTREMKLGKTLINGRVN